VNRRALEVALFVGALVVAVVTDLLVDPGDVEPWALGTLGSQILAGTVLTTATVLAHVRSEKDQKVELAPLRAIFALPVAVTAVLTPTIVGGGGLDPDMAAVPSLLLFVLVGALALLLGVIVSMMVVLPVLWAAHTIVALARGSISLAAAAGSLPIPGLLLGTALSGVGGASGLRLPGSSGRNAGAMLQGLLGIGDYSVRHEGWLLAGRIGLAMLVVSVLAYVVIGLKVGREAAAEKAAARTAADETQS
jgi:hypothetical protein